MPTSDVESALDGLTSPCRVAVIGAGMPRAGSTLQERLIFFALADMRMGPAYFHAREGTSYWDWPQHVALDDTSAKKRRAAEAAWARRLNNLSVVYYKSHEFAPGLLHMCREPPIIFTTHRCLRSVVRSAVAAKWLDPSVASIRGFAVNISKAWARWRAAGSHDIAYVELAAHPEVAYERISANLADRLGVSSSPVDVATMARSRRPVSMVSAPANARIPHRSLTPLQEERVNGSISIIQRELNGTLDDPSRLGLSWC